MHLEAAQPSQPLSCAFCPLSASQATCAYDVPAVTFRGYILSESLHRGPCAHLGANGGLNSHFVLLSRDNIFELNAESLS